MTQLSELVASLRSPFCSFTRLLAWVALLFGWQVVSKSPQVRWKNTAAGAWARFVQTALFQGEP